MKYIDKVITINDAKYICSDNRSFDTLKEAINASLDGIIKIINPNGITVYQNNIFNTNYYNSYSLLASNAYNRTLYFNNDSILFECIEMVRYSNTIDTNIYDFEYMYGNSDIKSGFYENNKFDIGFNDFYNYDGTLISTFNRDSIMNSIFTGDKILGPICKLESDTEIYEERYIPLGILKNHMYK